MDKEKHDTAHNSADAWLQRNLSNKQLAAEMALPVLASGNFRLHILPLMLIIAAVTVTAMWYQEVRLELVSGVDRFAYPLLLLVTTAGALMLKLHPQSLRLVMVAVFLSYLFHLMASYYIEMAERIGGGEGSSYELAILALWLPLGYVSSFVFFSPRVAVRTSIAIYVAISLPPWWLLGVADDQIQRQVAIAILVSQPVYIAALWGVRLLKEHASGVHDLAKNMSVAASVDELTGIANRRALLHALHTVTGGESRETRSLALMMIDVDHFKRINDNYGHAVGDEVLIQLSLQLNTQLRSSDLLGRWGGEEFMVVTIDQPEENALQLAERLRCEINAITFETVGSVTVSIGVTTFQVGESIDNFVNRADRALYRAKDHGRNRVEAEFMSGDAA